MDVLKSYKGTAPNNGTIARVKNYGVSGNVTVNTGKTDEINNIIAEFLKECHVENVNYDGNFLWIEGVPFHIYNTGTTAYLNVALPTMSGLTVTGSASIGVVFSGYDYNFQLRFLGEPKETFFLIISNNQTTTTLGVGSIAIGVAKGKNMFNGKEVRLYNAVPTASSAHFAKLQNPYVCGIEESGSFTDIGHSSAEFATSAADYILYTTAEDFINNPGKMLLIQRGIGPFLFNGVYKVPQNAGISTVSVHTGTVPVYEIDGETYMGWYYGLIHCTTNL